MICRFILVGIFKIILYVSDSTSNCFFFYCSQFYTTSIQKELKYSQPNSLLLFISQCNFTVITRLIKPQSKILKFISVEFVLVISQKSAAKTPIILHLQNEEKRVFFRGSKDPESMFSWNCNILYYCCIFLNFLESHRFFIISMGSVLTWKKNIMKLHVNVTWQVVSLSENMKAFECAEKADVHWHEKNIHNS